MAVGLHFHLAEDLPPGHGHCHFGFPSATLTAVISAVAPAALVSAAATLATPPLTAAISAVAPVALAASTATLFWHPLTANLAAIAPAALAASTATLFWHLLTADLAAIAPVALSQCHAHLWLRLRRDLTCPYTDSARALAGRYAAWGLSQRERADQGAAWGLPVRKAGVGLAAWSRFNRPAGQGAGAWGLFDRLAGAESAGWQHLLTRTGTGRGQWAAPGPAIWKPGRAVNDKAPAIERRERGKWTLFSRLANSFRVPWDTAPLVLRASEAIWGLFTRRSWDGLRPDDRPPNPPPVRTTGPAHLFFHLPGWPVPAGFDCRLHFGRKYSAARAGIYMITELGLFKLPNLEPIRFQNLTIDAAIDSYSRLLRATIKDPASYALLQPDDDLNPVEVRAVLNGYTWDFVVTDTSGSVAFADSNWTMTAESPIIYLGSPYAPARDVLEINERTANQLAEQEIENTGFDIVWDCPDWLVPANVWSYQNLTPLDAIKRIAATVGAYVSDDPVEHTLYVRSRYPINPWLWPLQVPTTTLSASQIKTKALQNYRNNYQNQVIVSGGNIGKVRIIAVRSGTAGDVSVSLAPDSLICHYDAGQERARVELAAARRHCDVVLTNIVLAPSPDPPGLLAIGDLVQVEWGEEEAWIGMVVGVKIDAAIGSLLQDVVLDRFLG